MRTERRKKVFRSRNDAVFYVVMLAWPVLQFLLFYVAVNANSFVLAFRAFDGVRWGFAGLSNFKEALQAIFHGYVLKVSIKNSVVYFMISVVVRTGFALLFSYYIFKKLPFAKVFRICVFIPQIVSIIIMVVLYRYFSDLLVPSVVNKLFHTSFQGLMSDLRTVYPTVVFFNLWTGIASSLLIYLGSMNNVSQDILEAGKIDGVNAWQEFFRIIFPAIWPTFVTFLLVSMADIFTNQLNIFSFFGQDANIAYSNIGYYLYAQLYKATPTGYPLLAAMGLCFTVVAIPLVLGARKLLMKFGPSED